MLVFPVEPTVGGVQLVIAVQSLVIVVEHLSDNLFQFLNEWVNKPLLIGLGGHQGGWIGELKLCIRLNSLLQPLNGMCPLIEVVNPILYSFQLVLLFGKRAVQCSNLFFSLLLLVVQNREVLFVGTFLLPLNIIPLHHGGKLLLFGLYPLRPFRCTTSAALEALRRQRLLQRYTGIKPSFAPGGERHKVNVQMRRCLVHTHTHSVSIETQQMIIARYLEQYPEISVYDTYIDNGATGTNFHRPGFQQMLSDIEAGHVNCVIVKDLSRLGRNTIDTGYYIEQYFRIRSIRFIAVNENFDTAAPEDAHSGIIIPLRNMINEAYALDIGRKIRAQQRQAMKDGKFIGARTPYGYLKAENDCHQLIIDPVAAVVVQRMFRWASEGAGLNTIAVRLNEAGILTPSHYKKMQGKITHANLLGSGKWQTRTVGAILRSEVYTGDLVQGQTKTVDHRQVKADAEEWTVVRDTHEAIISREQFAAVQEILNQTASRAKAREVKAYTPNLLKGKVFCAHCGGSLHRQRNIRKKSDDVYFYHCLSQSRISKDTCPGVTIREDALLDMLADMLQDALDTALGQYTLSLAEQPRQAADRAELREKITNRRQEIQRLRGIVRSLYENLVQGVLTKDEYFDYKEKYESRIADLAVEMEQLEDGLRTMDTQIEQHRALEQDAAQIKTDRALTGALIERLIDRIEVSHDKQITVRYRFQSEFETYAEVLEQCRNM